MRKSLVGGPVSAWHVPRATDPAQQAGQTQQLRRTTVGAAQEKEAQKTYVPRDGNERVYSNDHQRTDEECSPILRRRLMPGYACQTIGAPGRAISTRKTGAPPTILRSDPPRSTTCVKPGIHTGRWCALNNTMLCKQILPTSWPGPSRQLEIMQGGPSLLGPVGGLMGWGNRSATPSVHGLGLLQPVEVCWQPP